MTFTAPSAFVFVDRHAPGPHFGRCADLADIGAHIANIK